MAIHQTKRQSDLEKRLQLLRRQVYGKEEKVQSSEFIAHSKDKQSTNYQLPASQRGEPTTNSSSDLTYLHQDLLKILIFASCAIGTQAILFLLVKNNVFTLVFR